MTPGPSVFGQSFARRPDAGSNMPSPADTISPSARKPLDPRVDLLLALARALHCVGLPAHRLEAALLRLSHSLGVPLQVMTMPTGVLMSFDGQVAPMTFVLRAQAGRIDLRCWSQLNALVRQLDRGAISVEDARRRL